MIELNSSNDLMASEEIKIPFHDLDPGNVVWHGRYLKYFESARTLLFEGIGYSFDEMTDSGVLWPMVDLNIRYVYPLLLNQEVRVTACLKEWELRLVVEYEIVGGQGVVYTRARTVQAPVNADTHELVFGSPSILVSNVQNCLQELSTRND